MRVLKTGMAARVSALIGFAAAAAYGQVVLSPISTPATVGTTVIVQGTGFPAGAIGNNTVAVTITPPPGNGAAVTVPSVGVTAVGAQRLISFTIPGALVVNASIVASVSVAGTTATNNHYTTQTPATLTVNPPPSVSNVSPGAGTVGTQVPVSIAGNYTSFQNTSTITIAGTGVTVLAGSVQAVSTTLLKATLVVDPSATPGARDVTVKTGTQTAVMTSGFVVAVSPGLSFSSLTPNSGQLGQTLDVTVTGINTSFTQGTTFANFGDGVHVNSITVSNPSQFTANVTVSATTYTGWRMVTAVTGGQYAVTGAQGFDVTPSIASLISISQTSAPQGTNITNLVVTGLNTHFLQNATTMSMGAGINVGNIQVTSATNLTANIAIGPAATVGAHDVTVTTGGETETLSGAFTVTSSTAFLSSITPTTGAQGTTVPVQVTGVNTNFTLGTITADFGSNISTAVAVNNATSLTINATISLIGGTGARNVILHDNGTDFTFQFTVTPSTAQITSVTPNSGPQGGSPSITVTGLNTHWVQGTTTASITCCVNTPPLTVNRITINSPTSAVLDITIPANAAVGAYTLTMATGGETVNAAFSVEANTPSLTIAPGSGVVGGSVPVALTGQFTNFDATTTLNISGEGVAITKYNPANNNPVGATATFVIDPAAPSGARTVTVTTGSQVVTTTFGVTTTPAVLTAITPNHSPRSNTLNVIITGQFTHFVQGTTTLSFGPDIAVASPITVSSPAQITASITVDNAAAYGWRTAFVNTGAEQLQIGFLIDRPTIPAITGGVDNLGNPAHGFQGETVTGVVISGANTHWDATTQLILGAGVTINNLQVQNNTTMVANVVISPTAPIGGNVFVAITGSEVASGTGVTVLRGPAQILSVTPTDPVTQNQTLTLTLTGQATHWLQGETTASFGDGINVDVLTILSPTSATAEITVLSQASVGFHTATLDTDGEIASLDQALDVEQGTPTLLSSTPNAGLQGETKNIQVLGRFTHWVQGTTQAAYSSGINVNFITVTDSVTATLNVTIDPLAFVDTAPPCRSLTITTGTEQVSLLNQFCIAAGPAQITSVSPVSSIQGSTVTVHVTGLNTHFLPGVTTADFGAGVNVSAVHVNSLTSADVDLAVSVGAATGLRTATLFTQGETASMANAFTVSPGVPTLNGVAPVSGLQGTTINVHIIGQFTHWAQGTTTATFGQGIIVNTLVIGADQASADANITIDPLAYIGARVVTMTTNSEIVSGNFFAVTAGIGIITGLTPSTGNQGQERVITITGQNTHWAEGLTQFSMSGVGIDITVNGFAVNSPTSATADIIISPTASLYARSIYISTGGEVLSDSSAFVVTGGIPSITFLSPGSGLQGASQLNVAINGVFTNWNQSTTVDFGPCVTANGPCITLASYTVNSATSITAVINIDPTAAPGFNQVTVRTGTQALTASFGVTAPGPPPAPFISYISPNAGIPGQIFTVSITGQFTHWDLTTQATFGAGIQVNNFQVVTPTTARANISIDPGATGGVRTVTLTTGTDGEIETASFNVVIATPYISIVDPASALQGETGKDINVIGQYTSWDNTTTFSFGAGVTINSVTVLGPDIARVNVAVSQIATLGARAVIATTGTHTDSGCCFTVTPSLANISSISPNTALQNDTPTVSVVGQFTHWDATTTFTFGGFGIGVTGKTFVDATHYTLTLALAPLATLGAHALTADTAGEVATLNNAFVVQPGTPLILSSAPASIQQQATLNLTVLGQDTSWTQADTSVSFGANSGITVNTINVTADGLGITASISAFPTAFTGYRTLYVTTGSQVLALPNAILVTNGPAVISQLSPNNGRQNQANIDVQVTGTNTNFAPGVTGANFGQGITVNSVTVNNSLSATVNISILPTAVVTTNSVILTTLGETAGAASAFTINQGVPIIQFVNPSTAKQGDTKDIQITAGFTHFAQGSTTADFGTGVTINSVTVTDPLHATVNITVPPTSFTGGRNVTMTTDLGGGIHEVVVGGGAFSVVAGPAAIISAVPTSPATVHQGDAADTITITGSFTNFTSGLTTVTFCSGIIGTNMVVQSATSLVTTISVPASTPIGNCGATVTTAGEVATGSNLFTILPGIPAISQIGTTSAHQGDSNLNVLVTGAFTHFAQNTTTASFGAGITVNTVTVSSTTSATVNISVLATATVGARDVTLTTGAESATLLGAFTVATALQTQISGHVTNHDNSPAPGAKVYLTSSTGGQTITIADQNGLYAFPGVPLDSYNLAASAQGAGGLGTAALTTAGQQLTVDIKLGGGLVIVPSFDTGIQTDANAAPIVAAINAAIATYETQFSDPVAVIIAFQKSSAGLGSTSTFIDEVPYTDFYNALSADSKTPDDATALLRLAKDGPGPNNPITGTANVLLTAANAHVLGLDCTPGVCDTPNGGTVSLNTGLTTPGSPGSSNAYFLIPLVEHETDEILGLLSTLGEGLSAPFNNEPTAQDFFRFTSTGVRSFSVTAGVQAFFSLDGTTDLAQFSQSSGTDYGDWQSNPHPAGVGPQVQDAFATSGANPQLGVELRALDAIGYDRVNTANLALNKPASQSSIFENKPFNGAAAAVDGNADGSYNDGSVAVTNADPNAWWQVDLGTSAAVSSIAIWNRTDCCGDRLGDYWVFVSDTPFSPADTPATLQNRAGTWSNHQTLAPNPTTIIPVNATGRYVRVQLSGTNYLQLAEVQVFGVASASIASATPTNPVTVYQGDSADLIEIIGSSTHFAAGSSSVVFCAGVTTLGVQVQSAASLVATVIVDPGATVGGCGVTVTTGAEIATGSNLFNILAGVPAISLGTTTGRQGDSNVNINVNGSFTHFAQGTTTASFGAAVTVNSVTVNSQTSAIVNISVQPAATTGARDVTLTTGAEMITLSGGFTVLASVPTSISGVITKPNSTPDAGAAVVLTPAGQSALSTLTDANGAYSFTNVPIGTFTMVATDAANNLAGSASGVLAANQQLVVSLQLAACDPAPSGLIHWWPGDGNANDVVSGDNGTMSNGATSSAGKVGQGFSFSGAGLISIPAKADMDLTAVTMEGWIRMYTLPTAAVPYAIATKGIPTATENYGLYALSTGELLFEWGSYSSGAGNHQVTSSGAGLTVGVFHHIAVTADGAQVTIYVDGRQASQVAQVAALTPSTGQFQIGSDEPSFGNRFNGIIDELSLYNRALSPAEVLGIYADGSNGKCKLCIAPPSNLVSWWTGDADNSDLIGANNPAAANAVTLVPGVVGQAFKFGTGGYIDMQPSASLANQQFTWTAWARPDGAGPNNDGVGSTIVEQNINNVTTAVGLYWRSTDSRFELFYGSNSEVVISQHAFPVGQFYLVTGTYDGSVFKLYVNGVLEGQAAVVKTIAYSSNTWTIGAESSNIRAAGFPRTWNGAIDEVQAFNRALTQAEVQAIYNAGAAGECRPSAGTCSAAPSGLVAWWTEDGTLLDATNNNNPAGSNAVTFVPGKAGLGAQFTTGSYIDIPASPNLANQKFTWSAWARPDGTGPNNDQFGSVIIQQDIDAATSSVALWWRAADNKFLFGFGNDSTEVITSPDTFPPGQFYLVTATYDGATFSLYVNGKLEVSKAEVKTIGYSNTAWTIGSTNSTFRPSFPRTWNGAIDEVQAFNRALSQAEIQAIYAAGNSGECKPAPATFLKPISYSMPNGTTGTWHYWDDTYNGSGNSQVNGAALSGGVGQLTDGYVGAAPYSDDSGRGNAYEWVGWDAAPPTITFDFGAPTAFNSVAIHSHNQLDVPLWTSVVLTFSNDGVNFSGAVTYTTTAADKANTTARFFTIPTPGASGRYVRASFTAPGWMMISEVQFQ